MLDNFRCHCCRRRRRRHSFYLHSLSSLCVCVYCMQDTADEHSFTRLATKMNVNTIFSRAYASAFFVCVHCDVRSMLLARSRRLVFNILSFIYMYIHFSAISRYYCSYSVFILFSFSCACIRHVSAAFLWFSSLILLHFWHFFCFSIRFVCVRCVRETLKRKFELDSLYWIMTFLPVLLRLISRTHATAPRLVRRVRENFYYLFSRLFYYLHRPFFGISLNGTQN